jgi:hypothetical protein
MNNQPQGMLSCLGLDRIAGFIPGAKTVASGGRENNMDYVHRFARRRTRPILQQSTPTVAVDQLQAKQQRRSLSQILRGRLQVDPRVHPLVHQLAPAPANTIQTDRDTNKVDATTITSKEVPDLTVAEVTAIKAVLKSDRAAALKLLGKALLRIDAQAFSQADLEGNKLHVSGGSSTAQGAAFQGWLMNYLDKYAKDRNKRRSKLTKAEVKAAIARATVPVGKKDIRVRIGRGHFASVSLLYSTVRHEFIHVQQLRKDYLAHIPDSVMPSGVNSPSSGTTHQDRELEAYLWEMEHLSGTGLSNPSEIHLLWESCSNAWLNAGPRARKKFGARFKKAFRVVWGKAMDAHLAAIASQHAVFLKTGSVPDEARLRTFKSDMGQMWIYRNNHRIKWRPYTKKYAEAGKQLVAMLGSLFKPYLKAAKKALQETDPAKVYAAWLALLNQWINLDRDVRRSYRRQFAATAPALWKRSFTLNEKTIIDRVKAGKKFEASGIFEDRIKLLYGNAAKSKIKSSRYRRRYKKLERLVK